jgi:hypothetical protein
MIGKSLCGAFTLLLPCISLFAQTDELANNKDRLDSLYIEEVENTFQTDKVLHAEPLYIDLIRDLGARKGEREWNVGMGLTDNLHYDAYQALVEYEWAPINRLGLEVELPFSFYYPGRKEEPGAGNAPGSRLNSLKLAAQYSFFVSEHYKTSMAVAYLHEFELSPFNQYREGRVWRGNVYNPVFIAAKRWGDNYHTLVYAGPVIEHDFNSKEVHTNWQVNTSFHYMISGTRNFIGVEFNKEFYNRQFDMTVRPQMRLGISDQLMLGIVAGVPVYKSKERLSSFIRLIYEPKHKQK